MSDVGNVTNAYNDTYESLNLYYRDTFLKERFVKQYQVNQILKQPDFLDVSNVAEGLSETHNVRFAIATNKASDVSRLNPDAAQFGFHTIQNDSFYKILDIYKLEGKTQILLLHFDAQYLEIIAKSSTNIDDTIIDLGRKNFEDRIKLEPRAALTNTEWLERTQLPVGLDSKNQFFFHHQPYPISKKEAPSKPSFLKRLFS